ncbi:MAG: hypothetical protein JJT94_14745, partial [Bernardetiaceae bacterium]|nr:hypothetical protein [Bernardetiaceae bacterium]
MTTYNTSYYITSLLTLIFFVSINFGSEIKAQEGHYYLKTYQHDLEQLDQSMYATVQDANGLMYFA